MSMNLSKRSKQISLVLVCLFAVSCGGKVISVSKDINEANSMIVALKESGIDSYRGDNGLEEAKKVFTVSVEDGFFSTGAELEAMRILQDNCLPYTPPAAIAEGSMGVSSTTVESEKRKRQAQIDLEQLFRTFKGVTCVKAILVYPEKSIDSLKPYSSSATIKIRYKSQNQELTKEIVQYQTARAVEKLDPANVDVSLEFVPVEPANLNSSDSWKKLLITGGVAFGLTGLVMILILWMRKRKQTDDDPEENELQDENELNLLESGEEE
jgi:type III secretory pathway lipoprotein EscJ